MKKFPPIAIIGALFFIFGFVTWLNATLIPYLKLACELTAFESMFVAFAFYIAYFVFAIPSGMILKRTGFKRGMSLGLLVMAIGAIIFIPASLSRSYGLFLTGLFVMGSGLTILQTASNPYVAIIGPAESAAKRISIMGICNKLAGGLGPLILGTVVLSNIDEIEMAAKTFSIAQKAVMLDELAMRAIVPYFAITFALVILAFLIKLSNLPDVQPEEEILENKIQTSQSRSIWSYPRLIFGAVALFFYVGAEVIAVDTLIGYWKFWGFATANGTQLPMFAMLALILGYFIGIATIPKYMSQGKALLYSALLGLILVLVAQFSSGVFSVACIVGLGLAHALVWPSIWGLAIVGLGRHTQLASSLLIMAIAGGATLPLLYGFLTDLYSAQIAYWMLIPCYLIIGGYAVYGGGCFLTARQRRVNK